MIIAEPRHTDVLSHEFLPQEFKFCKSKQMNEPKYVWEPFKTYFVYVRGKPSEASLQKKNSIQSAEAVSIKSTACGQKPRGTDLLRPRELNRCFDCVYP